MTLTEELSAWASTLQLADVPGRVVEIAKSQLLSQLAAARAGAGHPAGRAVISAFGPPLQADPKQSACVLAGLTSWLHFDDTAYAGHISNSTATVPIAYAHALGLDGRGLLTSMITANECASRVTAAATLGPFRGQSATHTHVTGAVSGRLRSENRPADRWVAAFGMAFGIPPRMLAPGFLNSDAKVLSAFTPVRAGLDACDAALAGLAGAPDILEHPQGFLSRFSTVPLPEAVTLGLGERWHTETLSFKMHPGGPGIDSAVDCAIELHRELGEREIAGITDVLVHASLYTVVVDRQTAPYVDGPDSPVSALVFSTPYTVATTLLNGELTPADFAAPRVHEPRRWELAAKIRLTEDRGMTRDSFLCEVPFGEALRQAGPRAATWLTEFGGPGLVELVGEIPPPSVDFTQASKVTGARVVVTLADGSTRERRLDIPIGAVGPDTRARHAELVREKFLSTGGAKSVADAVADLEHASAREVAELLETALLTP
ncbi:MmgE/PrpD family protein [Actinoplanes sp. NPDC049118]|uniref:MmgE/PrpD family protein n=1 Tax=Actinoplanes sp. NPDC049118 TaxID=3155769 RepID=UPI0033D54164